MAIQSCIQRLGPPLLIALSLLATAAGAQPLTLAEADGRVEYRQGDEGGWRTVTAGATLALPGELRTGPEATARLVQGDSSFRVRGGTRLGLASRENRHEGLLARVRQWLGTVFYRVERQPDTFSVETPFLVSTVKGTRFIVVTTEAASFVTLTEGSLEVRDLASDDTRLLSPGDVIEAGERPDGLQGFRGEAPDSRGDDAGGDAAADLLGGGDDLLGDEDLLNDGIGGELGEEATGDLDEGLEELGDLESERRGEETLEEEEGEPFEDDGGFAGGEEDGAGDGDGEEDGGGEED